MKHKTLTPPLSRADLKYLQHLRRLYKQLHQRRMEHEPYHTEKIK